MHRIVETDMSSWSPRTGADASRALAGHLELGKIVYLPRLPFALADDELRFLDARWLTGKRKSVSFDAARAESGSGLRGAQGDPLEKAALAGLIGRFRTDALSLVCAIFPAYGPGLRVAQTSFRPGDVETRKASWRQDDTRLHVDAFPTRPNHGERILRVFANINPRGMVRLWKIGDLFEATASEFLPRVRAPLPGSARLLRLLHLTKSKRSLYDHVMLSIHDNMKRDLRYQQRPGHLMFGFPPGSTWICFSDQTAHAALAGQFMLEQTLHLPVAAQYFPEHSPLKVLERLRGAALV